MDGASTLTKWSAVVAAVVGTSSIIYAVTKLVAPIIWPTIIPYPWPNSEKYSDMQEDKNKTVVLAGSFNPPHNGHLAMLVYLSERYREVIVVVGKNPQKQYLVSPEERADLIERMIEESMGSNNIRVEVVEGYIWRTVKPMGARMFIRGIRSWEKDGAEERSLQILNTWGPLVCGPFWWPLPTVFLEGKPEYNHVSSTLIRKICLSHGDDDDDNKKCHDEVATLVPSCIAKVVVKLYGSGEL